MTQTDVANRISASTGIDESVCMAVMNEMKSVSSREIAGGIIIKFEGLGTFRHSLRKEKKGIDFYRKKQIVIKEHYVPQFRFCKEIKERMKG